MDGATGAAGCGPAPVSYGFYQDGYGGALAAEAFAEFGEGQVGGFQLGSFSVTHYDNRGTTGEEQATYACEKELSGTGLLFCGAR